MPDRIELPPLRTPSSFDWNNPNEREHIAKHGIRFGFAIGIFLDPLRIENIDMRRDYGELRYNAIDVVDGTYLNVTFTMRGETGWIISARPASRKERRAYDRRS